MTTTSDLPSAVSSHGEMLALLPETIVHLVDGQVQYVNRAESPVFLHRASPGDQIEDLFDADSSLLIGQLASVALESGSARTEHHAGGRFFNVQATKLASSPGLMIHFQDITVRRSAEHTLLGMVQDKSSFLTAVGNQLQAPLTAVIGYADMLSQPDPTLDDGARASLVRDMTDHAWELAGMIEDLLASARAEIGDLHVATVPVNLIANVAQVVESIGERGVGIEVTGERSISGMGDPARFRQMVRNLVSNAMTHGAEPIVINATYANSGAVLEITDHGPGLPTEVAEALFPGPDSSGFAETSMRPGVGLWISTELAYLMNGEITYERVGDATTFRIWLPILGS